MKLLVFVGNIIVGILLITVGSNLGCIVLELGGSLEMIYSFLMLAYYER